MLVHDASLFCTDFEKPFRLDTDTSKTQLGGMMHQDHGAIAYHSRKLTKNKENYPTPEK